MALNARTITNKEYFYGHKACPGCGAALCMRLALKVLGERAIALIPPNCMSTVAFIYPNMPIAASLEGSFRSAYAHRMTPEGVITDEPIRKQGKKTRQVVIGSGSMVINEIEGGQPIPLGFDRASGIQYGNRDFIINSMLWLTHTEDLIPLRAKGGATLRPLNKTRAYSERTKIEKISTISPIVLLALIGGVVLIIRRMKYASKKVKR